MNICNRQNMLNIKNQKLGASLLLGGVFFALAAGIGGFYIVLNREYLRQSLNKEKLAHERLYSEKLLTDKELEHKSSQVDQLARANQQLTVFMGNAAQTLDEKGSLMSQLAQNEQEINSVKHQISHLDQNSEQVKDQLNKLNKTVEQLMAKNNQLLKQVNQLTLDNQQLKATNNVITIHKGIGRAFRVEAWRNRGKELTTKAKRTGKLVLSFEPSDRHEFMKIKKEVFFVTMSDESGAIFNILSSQKKTVQLDGNPVDIIPSFELLADDAEQVNRINVSIEKIDGLKPGIYNFDVYTSNAYVGNAQIRLN